MENRRSITTSPTRNANNPDHDSSENKNTDRHLEFQQDQNHPIATSSYRKAATTTSPPPHTLRVRKKKTKRYRNRRKKGQDKKNKCGHAFWQGTLQWMKFLGHVLLWASFAMTAAGVVWYGYELTQNGTDPHLIAWFTAGAFVLLGFPISIYGIAMHLSNYYQPNIQCYVVRILWMVPLYSIGSWLSLRFIHFSIYIETIRDCYESYVLYCFMQFLIEVLGGEEELTLILKDKSPTRGVHLKPMNWFIPAWIMGQPIRISQPTLTNRNPGIRWRSPFFINCKFGCFQYVLLKNLCAWLTVILEMNDLYKEGDFSPSKGYLYICIITNTSQCWALYCLAFFYFATKNELSPIRPVGKFLAVKLLVFFTWWQSLFISIIYQMGLIPSYDTTSQWSAEDVAKALQDYLICVEMFLMAIVHIFVFSHTDYLVKGIGSGELFGTRKNLQRNHHQRLRLGRKYRYRKRGSLTHTDDSSSISKGTSTDDDYDDTIQSEMVSLTQASHFDDSSVPWGSDTMELPTRMNTSTPKSPIREEDDEDEDDEDETCSSASSSIQPPQPTFTKVGMVSAFLDSAVPRDVVDNTVGIIHGQYHVEKKTLLHHATTSDEYELFSQKRQLDDRKKASRTGFQGGDNSTGEDTPVRRK